MSDPRQSLTTMDVVDLINVVKQAMGKVKTKRVRQRYAILRDKLQRIGQSDAAAINGYECPRPLHPESVTHENKR